MRINKYHDNSIKENRVDIYYREEDSEITALFDFINKKQIIIGFCEEQQRMIVPESVYYFEAVDKKCFAYLENEVYQIAMNLQEIESNLNENGFIRVNKSTVLNIFKIAYIKAEINMRVNAYLENNECIVINRSYKKNFNQRLLTLQERSMK